MQKDSSQRHSQEVVCSESDSTTLDRLGCGGTLVCIIHLACRFSHAPDQKATFAKSSYHLETEEAERILMDQVSHLLTWTRFHTCLISVDQVSHLLNKEAEKSRRRPLEAKTKTWTQRKGIKHGNVADETGCGQQA